MTLCGRSLLWKIFITAAVSAATFTVTAITHQPDTWALMLSAFVGGVTLVVQFMLDVEARQLSVDANLREYERRQLELTRRLEASVTTQLERFNQVNSLLSRLESSPLDGQPVLDLLRHAAELDHAAPVLIHRLAASQISDLSRFLHDLGRGREITADGDEWSWTITLTSSVRQSIDATSYVALDGDLRTIRDDDGWHSELGERYLELQAHAIQRGVAVRRVFILEASYLAEHADLRRILDRQLALGIDVRLLDAATASAIATSHIPLIIFDRTISYELTPNRFLARNPGFVKTTMVLNPSQVSKRLEMFQRLWDGAKLGADKRDQ